MDPKPGYKTTELYVTIAAGIVGVLVLTGKITPAQASSVQGSVTEAVGMAAVILPVAAYAISRGLAKLRGK